MNKKLIKEIILAIVLVAIGFIIYLVLNDNKVRNIVPKDFNIYNLAGTYEYNDLTCENCTVKLGLSKNGRFELYLRDENSEYAKYSGTFVLKRKKIKFTVTHYNGVDVNAKSDIPNRNILNSKESYIVVKDSDRIEYYVYNDEMVTLLKQ